MDDADEELAAEAARFVGADARTWLVRPGRFEEQLNAILLASATWVADRAMKRRVAAFAVTVCGLADAGNQRARVLVQEQASEISALIKVCLEARHARGFTASRLSVSGKIPARCVVYQQVIEHGIRSTAARLDMDVEFLFIPDTALCALGVARELHRRISLTQDLTPLLAQGRLLNVDDTPRRVVVPSRA